MTAVAFLMIVVGVSALGGLVLWLQHRSPNTLESGVDAFKREMDALAPPAHGDHAARSRTVRPQRTKPDPGDQ